MARERHALERQPDAAAHRHVEHRERDRDAHLAVHDLVQVAVARVVVRLGVAAVAEVLEQELVQRRDALLRCEGLRHAAAQAHRHALDVAEIALHFETGIGILRDQQAGMREVDAQVLARKQLGERLERHRHQAAPRREKSRGRKPKSARQAP